ncbi:MAG: hypothetical protein ACKVU1_13580 [bacterium]
MRMPLLSSNAVVALLATVLFVAPATAQPVADPTDLDMDGEPGVAEAPAVANPQIPSALIGTGSVLVDHSHQNDFFVNGFTDYLATQGWTIAQHFSGPITEALLSGYDILIVPTRSSSGPTNPFSASEVAAIQAFLAGGNGMWILNDAQNSDGINTLSTSFGVEFQSDYIQDPSNNEGGRLYWPTIYLLSPHLITSGVGSYGYFAGDCLLASPPSIAIATADEDAYSSFCPAGSYPPVLAVWENVGRAVFSGDGTPLHPNYYPERLDADEELLLQNIANWLLGDPPNATSATSWGSLKRAHTARDDSKR